MESTGQTTLNPNATIPTPVREKREIEEFEIEDFSTTKKPKSYTMANTFTPTATTFDNENYTETTTEFQMMETTTATDLEDSSVRLIIEYIFFLQFLFLRKFVALASKILGSVTSEANNKKL